MVECGALWYALCTNNTTIINLDTLSKLSSIVEEIQPWIFVYEHLQCTSPTPQKFMTRYCIKEQYIP